MLCYKVWINFEFSRSLSWKVRWLEKSTPPPATTDMSYAFLPISRLWSNWWSIGPVFFVKMIICIVLLLYMYVEFPFSVVHKWESLFYIVARHLARYHRTIWLLVTIYWRFLGSFMYKRKKVKTAPFHPSSHIGHKICLLLLWKIVRLSSLVKIEGVWLQSRITCRPIF